MELSLVEDQPKTPSACDVAPKLCSTEDSGYHTPFTTSLSDSGAFSTSSIKRYNLRRNPNLNYRRRFLRSNAIESSDSYDEPTCSQALRAPIFSPYGGETSNDSLPRRPLKRSLEQSEDRILSLGIASTPTSTITGDLERLHVQSPLHVPDFITSDYFSLSSIGETSEPLAYPTTPVKSSKCKIAKLSPKCERKSTTKRSPSKEYKENIYPKRSAKKLHYGTLTVHEPQKLELKPRFIIPDKKIDILSKLQERGVPAVQNILGYLDPCDLYNFSEVSSSWKHICDADKRAKNLRDNYASFIAETKENYSCRKLQKDGSVQAERRSGEGEKLKLRCIHNFTNSLQTQRTVDSSPSGTPRGNKLKKYMKCGSLDGRTQLACVRCCHPAKVTVEATGEQWAQCLSITCSFAFCRFCMCEHHPGKTCHSLDAPSPQKRRKQSGEKYFDSKKCRKNLRRLLES